MWSEWSCSVHLARAGAHIKAVMGNLAAARADFPLPSPHCLGGSQHVFLMSRVQASHSPPVCPSGPPTRQGDSSPLCRTPGLGHPVSNCSLPGVGLHLYFPFYSKSSPRGTGPDLIASLPFLPDYMCIFLTAWLYRCLSASFLLVFSEIVSRVNVFLICSLGELSSASSYSVILINSLLPRSQI